MSSLIVKGKNGSITVNDDYVEIDRSGWFGLVYQLLTGGYTAFNKSQIDRIDIKKPSITRGYISFKFNDGAKSSVVWLTNKKMHTGAQKVKNLFMNHEHK